MLAAVMDYCKKHFIRTHEYGNYVFAAAAKTITGTFDESYIVGGRIYVMNSMLNDTVFTITAVSDGVLTVSEDVYSENPASEYTVHIFGIRPPRALLSLVTDIEAWCAKHGPAVQGLMSESIDDYSVNYGLMVARGGGWQAAFAGRLSEYRSLFDDLPRGQ